MLIGLLLIPLIGALLVRFAPERKVAGLLALGTTVVAFALSLVLFLGFNPDGGTQYGVSYPWIPSLGISFTLGIDGISMLLILLTTFLLPVIILSSLQSEIRSNKLFYSLVLIMQTALMGVFMAGDGFLFYVFWELALIPIWFICLLWGGEERVRITLKFFIYTLAGSLLMLVGLIFVYLRTPEAHSFSMNALYSADLTPDQQSWVFWAIFLAFAIKIPVFPFHGWQPDTYVDAPAQGSMLLSGIMLKMGLFGVLKWLIPVVPQGVAAWGATAAVLSVIGVVYGSVMALAQKDFKRLIAYSSIAHVGLITAGLFALNMQSLQGGMYQMLSHGINVVGVFLIAEIIERNFGTRIMKDLGGLVRDNKLFSVSFMIIVLGSVALPLTNGFVGEFLILTGMYQYSPELTFFGGLTVILGAVYMLRAFQNIMLGDRHVEQRKKIELAASEQVILVLVSVMIVIMGVYPEFLMRLSEPAMNSILELAGVPHS
jgi:NADH-quinone oxidoreductase subunit M